MNRLSEAALAISLIAGATGCTSDTDPELARQQDQAAIELEFQQQPETNFSVARCREISNGWARWSDNDPENAGTFPEFTLGMAESYGQDGSNPVFSMGATILDLGGYRYQIAASNGEKDEIDVRSGRFSTILSAGNTGIQATVSLFLDSENNTVMNMNCLPAVGFVGSKEKSVPLGDLVPETPSTTIEPSETLSS